MQLYTFSFRVMGGPGEIQLYAESQERAQALFEACQSELIRIEKKYSRYDPHSVISRINTEAHRDWIALDEETFSLLQFADTAYHTSHRLFDITSGVLRRIWDFKRATPPSSSAVKEVLPLIGWDKVQFRGRSIRFKIPGMEIDLGGIGKEYAVDRGIGRLAELGANAVLLNLAGDLRVLKGSARQMPWVVGVVHPRMPGSVLSTVDLIDGAFTTSGDYERFFEYEGKRYCHILNPKTGYPVADLQSVSVFSPSCLVAGCLSTSAMLLGKQAGHRLLRESSVKFVMVDSEGRITASSDPSAQSFKKTQSARS